MAVLLPLIGESQAFDWVATGATATIQSLVHDKMACDGAACLEIRLQKPMIG
jgi:hypothetical protein